MSASLAMVSDLYGTLPIRIVGRSLATLEASPDQQSPTRGRRPTGATSAHHLVTPTRWRWARREKRIEVTLGANETIRCVACRFDCERDLRKGPLDCSGEGLVTRAELTVLEFGKGERSRGDRSHSMAFGLPAQYALRWEFKWEP